MASVVYVDSHAWIAQHVPVDGAEEIGVLENAPGQVRHLHAPDGRMERGRMCRVADAEADHEDGFGVVDGEEQHMGQRPHVPLREPRGRGHRVAVREERPSLRWRLGDGHDFGESLAASQ